MEQSTEQPSRQPVLTLLLRAIKLRCPKCGYAPLFCGWLSMPTNCPQCNRLHSREPGFFLGSIYFNYGVTAGLVVAIYFTCFFADLATPRQLLIGLAIFSLIFPALFFRHARAIWVAFDEYFDPS